MAHIEQRDGFYLLHIPGREAPMGFFSRDWFWAWEGQSWAL